jgi:glucose-1-phosphate thymidylyltransferase
MTHKRTALSAAASKVRRGPSVRDSKLPPRKGIILAGGTGSRLYPLTEVSSKQLLPVYDKPMVYYPLTTLMIGGIREILVISTPEMRPAFERLLKDGSAFGLKIDYIEQPSPAGIAQALLLGEAWLDGAHCCLILGDNIFFGDGLRTIMGDAATREEGATIFSYWVKNPEHYGVIEFDESGRPTALREKPVDPKSNFAVVGMYFYDPSAPKRARALKPSARGELEITDLNVQYLEEGKLGVRRLGRGFAWLDAGTPETLLQAASFVQMIEDRQGLKVSCPEEVAWRLGYIGEEDLRRLVESGGKSNYSDYLKRLLAETVSPTYIFTGRQ